MTACRMYGNPVDSVDQVTCIVQVKSAHGAHGEASLNRGERHSSRETCGVKGEYSTRGSHCTRVSCVQILLS